jgi:nitroimidazol reductase NimA-like FMN-containing flavoprotein (pyridoxamine 5'-phosphate oxidase superfamily)
MLIHELTREECLDLLARSSLGRLACARYNQPYVVPIHYSYDAQGPSLVAFSAIGQKVAWMRNNPKVCVEVDHITDKNHWSSVVVIGRYEEVDRSPEDAEMRQRAEQLFQQRPEWWLPATAKLPAHEHSDVVLFRISIDTVTGRRTAQR